MQTLTREKDKILADIDTGWALPASWYTSQEITDLEIERIFRKSWQYFCRTAQVEKVGDFVSGYVGGVPVVVIRNNEGITGFVNVCRHRRHEVAKGCGNTKILQCGYHAWTYGLDGCLKGAPRAEKEGDFKHSDFALYSVKVETWGPWVFVNCDEKAASLESHLGELPKLIADGGLDINKLKFDGRTDWNSDSNWKVMLENYLECYHCPVAHPGFSAVIDVDPDTYQLKDYPWHLSQMAPARAKGLEAGMKKAGYDPRGEIKISQYHLFWPNLTININPGYPNLSLDVWLSDGPDKACGFSEQYFAPEAPGQWRKDLIKFNVEVGNEDDQLTNSVQKGLKSGYVDRGRFLPKSEHLVLSFQKLVVKAMLPD
jgi:choline monooxygenase